MNLISSQPQDKQHSPVSFAIFILVAILVVGIMVVILQGPRMPGKEAAQAGVTNGFPVFEPPPNSPIASEPKPPLAIEAQAQTAKPSTATPVRSQQYKIARGDTFGTIARKFHVSVEAIEGANPGVKPNRLRIGQSIQIPATLASTPNPDALARR